MSYLVWEDMMNGLFIILLFFGLFHITIIIVFLLNRDKLKKLYNLLFNIVFELVFELGKTLLMAGVIGIYFIPETKDFTKALISGIIFFIVGYIARKDKK